MPNRIWRNAFFVASFLVLMLGFGFGEAASAEGDPTPTQAAAPKAHWPLTTYEFAPLMEGADIQYDFIVENKGQGPLTINKVQPD
ncbi:MAG: hypothetical protein HY911_04965 [Desulfobacterales bacterium]|nr:hypothetical protein [Desulfobacterales bacterium]